MISCTVDPDPAAMRFLRLALMMSGLRRSFGVMLPMIAAGSGTSVQEVNKLLKQFDDMSAMMKRMNKLGQKGLMRGGLSALMPGLGNNRRPF